MKVKILNKKRMKQNIGQDEYNQLNELGKSRFNDLSLTYGITAPSELTIGLMIDYIKPELNRIDRNVRGEWNVDMPLGSFKSDELVDALWLVTKHILEYDDSIK